MYTPFPVRPSISFVATDRRWGDSNGKDSTVWYSQTPSSLVSRCCCLQERCMRGRTTFERSPPFNFYSGITRLNFAGNVLNYTLRGFLLWNCGLLIISRFCSLEHHSMITSSELSYANSYHDCLREGEESKIRHYGLPVLLPSPILPSPPLSSLPLRSPPLSSPPLPSPPLSLPLSPHYVINIVLHIMKSAGFDYAVECCICDMLHGRGKF